MCATFESERSKAIALITQDIIPETSKEKEKKAKAADTIAKKSNKAAARATLRGKKCKGAPDKVLFEITYLSV